MAEKLGPWYLFALEQFGVDRCMFCSNFPVDKSGLAHTVSCSESFPCKDMRRLNFYTCCLLMTMVLMLISAAWSVALCCCGSRSNAFKRIVAHLPAEDKAKLFYGNASRLYRLGEEPKA